MACRSRWRARLHHLAERTRRRDQRGQDQLRGMRDRLRHRPGVECYERLKGKGPTGAAYFSPLSTGITFALTEKAPGDKIPLITMGYGRLRQPRRRGVRMETSRCSAPIGQRPMSRSSTLPRRWAASTSSRQEDRAALHVPLRQGTIAALEAMSKKYGFEFLPIPVPRRAASRSRSGCRSASSARTMSCCGAGAS